MWQHLPGPVPAGAGQDVGRSCILVSIGGKNVMLDCGMHMGFNDDVSPVGGRPGHLWGWEVLPPSLALVVDLGDLGFQAPAHGRGTVLASGSAGGRWVWGHCLPGQPPPSPDRGAVLQGSVSPEKGLWASAGLCVVGWARLLAPALDPVVRGRGQAVVLVPLADPAWVPAPWSTGCPAVT